MKKILIIILGVISFLFVEAIVVTISLPKETEIRFIYISYLEYLTNFNGNSVTSNQTKICKMLDNIKYYKFNTIILHVSPFSDSIYPSKIFPYSKTLSGVEGKNPGFDYLEYFLKAAHKRKIKVYAWINPYRISSLNNISELSENNPAIKFLNTENVSISNKGIYYDPTSELVKELLIKQVHEIIKNYNVDGIHLDDYFYIDYQIDSYEYDLYLKNGGELSLKDFRLMHTSDLIKRINKEVQSNNKNLVFSISPDGNINNNYTYHYADVKSWIENEYIDIIMPQIYYGFNNQYLPFNKSLKNWNDLINSKKVKIVPVLAFYKIDKADDNAGSGKNEWFDENVLIKQVSYLKKQDNYYGYGLFRYDYIFTKNVCSTKAKDVLTKIM